GAGLAVGGDGALLREGTKVEARYRGRARYYPGVIARARADGTYDIDYDDGEKETGVRADLIRTLDVPDAKGEGGGAHGGSAVPREGSKAAARCRGRARH